MKAIIPINLDAIPPEVIRAIDEPDACQTCGATTPGVGVPEVIIYDNAGEEEMAQLFCSWKCLAESAADTAASASADGEVEKPTGPGTRPSWVIEEDQ